MQYVPRKRGRRGLAYLVATVREVSVAVQATGAGQDGQEPEEVVDSLAHRVVGAGRGIVRSCLCVGTYKVFF